MCKHVLKWRRQSHVQIFTPGFYGKYCEDIDIGFYIKYASFMKEKKISYSGDYLKQLTHSGENDMMTTKIFF